MPKRVYVVELYRRAGDLTPDVVLPILAWTGTEAERLALGMYPRYEYITINPGVQL